MPELKPTKEGFIKGVFILELLINLLASCYLINLNFLVLFSAILIKLLAFLYLSLQPLGFSSVFFLQLKLLFSVNFELLIHQRFILVFWSYQ